MVFPDPETANEEGLLALGGDLSTERLWLAYKNGIFPWFNEDPYLMWWCPDPRMVIFPTEIKVSKSMRKVLRTGNFKVTQNQAFSEVLEQCANIPRFGEDGTWITPNMMQAYLEMHKKGHAKSVEVWEDGYLVGGLYGIDLGHVFCGESMFSIVPNASKVALIHLAQQCQKNDYQLIDCQMYTAHLESMGGREIPRSAFLKILHQR
ncbi:leucyl/phenylalanyl-tRNA--protein transferase [Sediminicola luteus]|uniref:Leucyl/phenylalanyl-tRNA--protein transferase n=1 Tax=Sediminicola luteus TaxID=319238 RepID=A0A2A4G372_9FLAO|nr:leucyl/phenylalanyl-tRNA--protein transferase [Sediminicola luteus]